MRKIYQKPETEIVSLHGGPFLDEEGTSGIGEVIHANETIDFDESEISTEETSKSLWDN